MTPSTCRRNSGKTQTISLHGLKALPVVQLTDQCRNRYFCSAVIRWPLRTEHLRRMPRRVLSGRLLAGSDSNLRVGIGGGFAGAHPFNAIFTADPNLGTSSSAIARAGNAEARERAYASGLLASGVSGRGFDLASKTHVNQ
jgi:hypothetical protein